MISTVGKITVIPRRINASRSTTSFNHPTTILRKVPKRSKSKIAEARSQALPVLTRKNSITRSCSEFSVHVPIDAEIKAMKEGGKRNYVITGSIPSNKSENNVPLVNNENKLVIQNRFSMLYDSLRDENMTIHFPTEMVDRLIKGIQDFLFSSTISINPLYYYRDLTLKLYLENFYEFEAIYNITFILMNYDKQKERQSVFESQDYISKFIKLLNSPDDSEKTILEMLLCRIIVLFPKTKEFVYHQLLKILDNFSLDQSNEGKHFCVDVIGKIILYIISDTSFIQKINLDDLHRTLIRLFKSDFLPSYYIPVNRLLHTIYSLKKQMNQYILKSSEFLIHHWPIQSSNKRYFYLHHILYTANEYCLLFPPKLLQSLKCKIDESLNVDCITVQISSIRLLSETSLFSYLVRLYPPFYSLIRSSIEQNLKSWSPYVVQEATAGIQKINFMEKVEVNDGDSMIEDGTTKYSMNWETIKMIASNSSTL
ncbi:hypothetical protein TRFO_39951 [Tritrichomonas foetus]|uniref:Uncharacterized protein n=1 Tax=Tritrichomonas foetus TaxID=1144522 RepID=A0A1J4J891_9EUKA|nr:hypothetical protein TRFO_39951 [Tritrichomonas foetus]|eukprot:OHS93907.1 hypothetical protein TRFO_39951 [Tritrichomonas foetus]